METQIEPGTPSIPDWVHQFHEACDSDPELEAHGKFYSCSFLLDMDEHCFVVEMHEGKVHRIVVDPEPLDVEYQFSVRASADTWKRFAVPIPEPMFHGIWAATFREDMRLEGEVLVMMQHLRTFTRQLELLRKTGVPVRGNGGAAHA